ncbi:MAG: anaerobic ribonucleoside-triphosphate reductase activating protein [Candidatus Woesearchaeota archaeon]
MKIAGYQKTSLQDFPGKIASIIFTQGCNFSCGYCHNADLIPRDAQDLMREGDIFDHIVQRKHILDGVVITGGEPTIQEGLIDFIRKLRQYGMLVKLDTNGSKPDILKALIEGELVDYVAMDYKFPLEEYKFLTAYSGKGIAESKDLMISSNVAHEFRITLIEDLFSEERLQTIANELKGARLICLQKFHNEHANSEEYRKYKPTTHQFMDYAREFFEGEVVLR